MSETTTARTKRDWFKMALLALLPALAVGLAASLLQANTDEAAAETVPSSTTSTMAAEATTTVPPASETGAEDAAGPEQEELEQEELEQDEPEQEPEQEEPAPLAPASMELPASVEADGSGKATIEIANTGDEPLEIFLVDVNDNPIEVGEVSTQIVGGSSELIELTVDTGDLEFGDYEMTVTISTSDGVGHVDVKGSKFFVFIPWLPNLDISTNYVLPHQVNHVDVGIVNNTDDNVTVGLSSTDDRLIFEETVELEPGENEVGVVVQALPLNWAVIDILELKVSYGATEMATVTITKHGS